MAQLIPVFSARVINESSHYVRFFHTKAYLEQKSRLVPHSIALHHEEILRLMTTSGYRNRRPEKFSSHRRQWDLLGRPIPRSYLESIGVDIEVMKFTAELDAEEYDEVLATRLYPRIATVRVMPAVYSRLDLPEGLDENEAVSFVAEFARKRGKRCCIGFRDIKTIWIESNGERSITFYRPLLRVTKSYVIPRNESNTTSRFMFD